MSKSNLLIYNDFYNLYIYLYPILKRFPKSEKFTLRQNIDESLLEIILVLDRFTKIKNQDKLAQLRKVNYLFDKFKLLIRISFDLGFIKQSNYLILIEKYELIGKQFGSLLKNYS